LSQTGSKLVNLSATSFEPDSVMEFGFKPACDLQLRAALQPASVMEFGFYLIE